MTRLSSLQAWTASKITDRELSYRSPGQPVSISPQSTLSATSVFTASAVGPFFKPEVSQEQLTIAQHVGGPVVSLQFADGYTGTVNLADLGIDAAALRLGTVRASSWGSAVEVEDARGETVQIDSAVLRAYCDSHYARQLGQAIADLEAAQ
jgi:hypothetical protein